MRNTLLLLFALAIASVSIAQTDQHSWASLGGLQPGQRIQVFETDSKTLSGTFVSFSDAAIAVRNGAGDQSVPMQNVRNVKLAKGNHRGRNTLIGAAIGVGVGAGITAAVWEHSGWLGGKGNGAAVGAVIGGLVGAVVGVSSPSHSTVYSAPSH
jgi:hypothetical protein